MEQPYKGRATIQDNYPDLQIIIPSKKNWFIIIFMCAWFCGWLFGEIFALLTIFGILHRNPASFFILFWLIGWTIAGFFVMRLIIWNLIGKEIITIGQGALTISKKGALLFKPRTFDLNEVKKIRVQDDRFNFDEMFARRQSFGLFNTSGTIRFDYGLRTVRFANGIDEAEARFIIEKLKERHLLTEKNYS